MNGTVRLQTKQGFDYAERYPRIVDAIMRLKATSIVLDGEAMCFTGVEHDFDKLWNRTHDHEATLCAFDLLELDGEDYRPQPLLTRKMKLFKLLKRHPAGVEYVEHITGDGATIFEHACKLGLEGIVSKRVDLRYKPGPSKSWIKVKNKKHPAMLRVKEAFESRAAAGEFSVATKRNAPIGTTLTLRIKIYWTPTAANINALPEPSRVFIHDMNTVSDPAGTCASCSGCRLENSAVALGSRAAAGRQGRRGTASWAGAQAAQTQEPKKRRQCCRWEGGTF